MLQVDAPGHGLPALTQVGGRVDLVADLLTSLRRDIHAHPELSHQEQRTTALVARRLAAAGLAPRVLPGGTGLVCDIGQGPPRLALRADMDALPVDDGKDVDYRSTVPGACHACGHDAHTAILVGAGLVLADLESDGLLPGGVRLIFQPAEEATPGGALDMIAAKALDGVDRIFALHCDPRSPVGYVGLRAGPITGSADKVRVTLTGAGGHTARPHLTGDLVYALARVVVDVPAVLSRQVDPRAGLSVVWGRMQAGGAANVIPRSGLVEGTVRSLDARAWERAPSLVEEAVHTVVSHYGVVADVDYLRGVPPVVNDAECVELLDEATRAVVGEDAVLTVEQSLGGEDFAWYLAHVPGALARLGVRPPGVSRVEDLHQSTFDIDESALVVGARVLVGTAVLGLV